MWIFTNAELFKPENFAIAEFYGVETLFAWQNKHLVVFPYHKSTTSTPKLPVIVAPREIKCIRCFESRVFVVCKPSGVYKLMETHKFSLLSHKGVGFGPFYYQVLTVEDRWLYCKNKSTKDNRQLFRLQTIFDGSHRICDITLSPENSENSLRRRLQQQQQQDDEAEENISVVANIRKVFVVTSKEVELIYRCEHEIVDIVPIFRNETIAGFVLVGCYAAVLVYVNDDKLVLDKIHLDGEVHGLCAGISETSSDVIWIAHTDHNFIYYSSKTISTGMFRRTGKEMKKLLAIANYKNKTLVGLADKQLLEIEITQNTSIGIPDSEEFLDLKSEMLKGREAIVDEVCERAKELQLLNETLLEEQEKLTRINIYAHKQAIFFLPKVQVERIAGHLFLRVKFGNVLPTNCHIVAALKSGQRTTYCMKLVDDSEVVVDIPAEAHTLDASLELSVDLVTLANESQPWCLIRNYTKNPGGGNARQQNDRTRFLQAKLEALRSLTTGGNLDMKKLSIIKKSIRRELSNL